MRLSEAFPGKYIQASDLKGRSANVTIERVEMENVAGQGKPPETKPVLYFNGKERGMTLNVTNGNTIAELLGTDEMNEWAGSQIQIYPTTTNFQGKTVACIRVRAAGPQTEAPTPRAATRAVPSTNGAARPAARPAMQMAAAEPDNDGSAEQQFDDADIPF